MVMPATAPATSRASKAIGTLTVNLTIPVHNEARRLEASVHRVVNELLPRCRSECEVVLAENGSSDATPAICRRLAQQYPALTVIESGRAGRGAALKASWLRSRAAVLSNMDADLSTDLACYPILVEAVMSGGFDLAAGSRLLKPNLTTRSQTREILSRGYNRLVRLALGVHFSDAQCGFKALSRTAAESLLPSVRDDDWFFDTELLVLAETQALPICDVPVRWVERRGSRVKILPTIMQELAGLLLLRRQLRRHRSSLQARANLRPRETAP